MCKVPTVVSEKPDTTVCFVTLDIPVSGMLNALTI